MSKELRVDSVRQVYSDGNHNAFTDLARFKGQYYLSFRSCPDGHGVCPSSRIVVMASEDAKDWRLAHAFSVPNRDVRQGCFLEFDGALFVYTGTWLCDPEGKHDLNDHQGYCIWSTDGKTWHGPRFLEGTQGNYIYRTAAHGGKAYLSGRRKRGLAVTADRQDARPICESTLLGSDDGFVWRTVGLFKETYGNETAFLFEAAGSVLAVARAGPKRGGVGHVCRSSPPYRDWSVVDLHRQIGGPMLAKWGDRYLVAGRKSVEYDNLDFDYSSVDYQIRAYLPKTTLYWLVDDQLEEIVDLPSGGDQSYPGFVELGPDRGLLSYYSSHEGSGVPLFPAAIYLAELSLHEE